MKYFSGLSFVAFCLLFLLATSFNVPAVLAAAPVVLSSSPLVMSSVNPGKLSVDVVINSPVTAISAVTVSVSSVNLRFISMSYQGGAFTQEVAAPSYSSKTTFSLLRADKGFTGMNGKVVTLLWVPIATGPASLTIDQATSTANAYQDGKNILSAVSGPVHYAVDAAFFKQSQSLYPTDRPEPMAASMGIDDNKPTTPSITTKLSTFEYIRYAVLALALALISFSLYAFLVGRKSSNTVLQ